MDFPTFLAACGAIALMLTVMFGLARLGRWLWITGRRLARLIDDLTGEPERPGMPGSARPGALARMYLLEQRLQQLDTLTEKVDAIEREMRPNGGNSMRDRIDVIAASVPAGPTPDGTEAMAA